MPKSNESSKKIFDFIKLLYEDEAYYEKVMEIFKEDLNEPQSLNTAQVLLNKYINTFKVFGMKVVKEKGKFKLLRSIYSMKFSLDDLKSISILTSSTQNFPDEKINEEVHKLLGELTFRMNTEDRTSFDNIKQNQHYNFSFQYLELKKQIEKCQDLCKSNQILDIFYIKDSKETHTKCIPKEILYDSKQAYFSLYDTKARQTIELPMTKILRIEVHPQIAPTNETSQTIVYKLSGRLAKTYKVKHNEEADGYDSQGNLVVINRGEPKDQFFQRLMRYATNCEIISPKNLRYEFVELIDKTLNNYED